MRLVNPWRMSLLFLISGAVTAIALGRGSRGWLGGRLSRLGLPLVAGMLVIVPPQSYWQVVEQMGYCLLTCSVFRLPDFGEIRDSNLMQPTPLILRM